MVAEEENDRHLREAEALVDGWENRRTKRRLLSYGVSIALFLVVTLMYYQSADSMRKLEIAQASIAQLDDKLKTTTAILASARGLAISSTGFLLRNNEPVAKITDSTVRLAAFSPVGNEFAVATSSDLFLGWVNPVKIVSLAHEAPTEFLVFSPDGKRLVSAGRSGARLWDVRTGAPAGSFAGGPVTTVGFSSDGTRLAAGTLDGEVRILDAATGAVTATLKVSSSVSAVGFSPDDSKIAIGTRSGNIAVVDSASGKLAWIEVSGSLFQEPVLSIEFSDDAKFLLVTYIGRRQLVDLNSRRIIDFIR